MSEEQIKRAIALLFETGQVVELRVPKCSSYGTLSGYYDSPTALAQGVAELSGASFDGGIVPAVYYTLNPVMPAQNMAVTNEWKANVRETTSDKDIAQRRWILVDIDPIRPAGVSATEQEKEEARKVADRVVEYLRSCGWPEPIIADSGNGVHLLYQIDLANDSESAKLVRRCLSALAAMFDTPGATVDRSVYNAARIVKCYGSKSCKGPDTAERPHRMAAILSAPAEPVTVSRVLLEDLATEVECDERLEQAAGGGQISISPQKVEEFLKVQKAEHGPRRPYEDGFKWVLRHCPWEDEHTSGKSGAEAAVFWFPDKMVFKCLHSHCTDRGWKEFRQKLEELSGIKYRFLPPYQERWNSKDTAGPQPLSAIRSEIQDLLYASRRDRSDLPSIKQAPSVITDLVWEDLNQRGCFFKDDQGWRAYLSLPKCEVSSVELPKVIPVEENTWTHSVLDRYYGLHAAEAITKRVIRQLGNRTLSERPSVPLHELGHYNYEENELYLCVGEQVIAVGPDSFAVVENGHKGFFFVPNRFAATVDATELAHLATEMMGLNLGMRLTDTPLTQYLFANTPFDPNWPVSPAQAKQLIFCGLLSLPFADFFPEKPVFYFTGGEDTGKTQMLRKAGFLIYGPKYEVTSMGDDPRDFTTALVNKYLLLIDDVGTDGDKAKAKANAKRLTQAATNGKVFQRRYYTNAEAVELDFKAWPWISGLSVFDRAPDFLSRLLNLSFRGRISGERQGPGEIRRFLEKNRLSLLAEYLARVQAIIRAAGNEQFKEKRYAIKFRISDWAIFLARCADAESWLDEYRDTFAALQGVRLMEASKDPLLIALKLWLMKAGNPGRCVEMSILYKELKSCAQGCYSTVRPDVEVPCLNGPKAGPSYFGSHLTSLAKTVLEGEYGFEEVPGGWDRNRNRVRSVNFSPSAEQMEGIRAWYRAWRGTDDSVRLNCEHEDAA
jgi:hypothetical protein